MAKNTAGVGNPDFYSLGRGILYASAIDASTGKPTGGWRDMGNCSEMNVTLESETLPHVSSRSGLQVTDKEVTLSQTMAVSFVLEEHNDENVALFMSGEEAAPTNAAIAGFSAYEMVEEVTLGRWYDIVDSDGLRAYDIDAADVTLTETDGPTNLVLDTDYTLDLKMGRIFLLPGASNIATGEGMTLAMAAKAEAATLTQVRGLTEGNVQRALKFIQENAANSNKKKEFEFHKVTIRSDGDYALLSQEYGQMSFGGTVEDASAAYPNSPYVDITDHANS